MDETNTTAAMTAGSSPAGKSDSRAGFERVPAEMRRNDDVGRLAWRLLNPGGDAMEFSAVLPLLDALGDAGDAETRERVRLSVHRFVRRADSINRSSGARRQLDEYREQLFDEVSHLFFDLGAVLRRTDELVGLARQGSPPVEESKTELSVVWVDLGYRPTIGATVYLPDGRRGVVMHKADSQGRFGVMPIGDGGDGGDGAEDAG